VKLVPPRLPASHVRRPALERLFEEAEQRRLTLIVAGAGFGKSTLAASVAIERGWSWYRADGADISPPAFAQGLSDALHLELLTEPFAAGAADALGNALAQALDEKLHEDVVLVLDDVHELGNRQESARVLETLVRLGPPELHLVLCTREDLPFPIERLRGQGNVLEIGASMLAFSNEETVGVVDSFAPELAPRIHDLTAGWPVAVQLAAALLESLPRTNAPAPWTGSRANGGRWSGTSPKKSWSVSPRRSSTFFRRWRSSRASTVISARCSASATPWRASPTSSAADSSA
jgi:ATP/maltotriose-dependent transcriptional regulator MalT